MAGCIGVLVFLTDTPPATSDPLQHRKEALTPHQVTFTAYRARELARQARGTSSQSALIVDSRLGHR